VTTVGIFFGGRSHEHVVSIETANALLPMLSASAHDLFWVYVSTEGRLLVGDTASASPKINSSEPIELLNSLPEYHMMLSPQRMRLEPVDERGPSIEIGTVLPLFHGAVGEDGSIQGLCRFAGVACAGPTILGAAVSLDKIVSKTIAAHHGIPVGPYMLIRTKNVDLDEITSAFDGPYVVKPRSQGSSLGVSFASSRRELEEAIVTASRFGPDCLVEQYLAAMEVHCYVLKTDLRTRVSLVAGKVPASPIYSYQDKTERPRGMRRLAGDDFDPAVAQRIQRAATRVFELLDGRGVARIDFFLSDAGDLLFNEVNAIPGLRRNAAYGAFNSWANHGLEFADIISELVQDQSSASL
jgi:D-alanine-D-alanine ligase